MAATRTRTIAMATAREPRRERGELPGYNPRRVATKRQVERKLRELIERMDENSGEAKQSLAQTLPDARIIELFVPDLPATYWTELSDGRMHRLPLRLIARGRLEVEF